MARVEYRSNNSGGRWWLSDADWRALEKAGWTVDWATKDDPFTRRDDEGTVRYMGALATVAYREINGLGAGISPDRAMREAIEEFNSVTSCTASSLGCFSCCGPPHSFTLYDDAGKYLSYYSPEAPEYGSDW